MELENQVISLELAKRLQELNINQESLFYYLNIDGEGKYYLYYIDYLPEEFEYTGAPISAFTSSELLDLLPHRITTKEDEPYNGYRLRIEKSFQVIGQELTNSNIISNYIINYYCDTTSEQLDWLFRRLTCNSTDENFANACAKMLIYLIENGLINESNTI